MIKNIYTALGFTPSGGLIFPEDAMSEARGLFSSFPLKYTKAQPLLIEQKILEESLAISTAEDSTLTIDDARNIEFHPEQELRISHYRNLNGVTDERKYEMLEFDNIRSAEVLSAGVKLSITEVSVEFLTKLHFDLTVGLDAYVKKLGVSSYKSGEFRVSDSVKVGKIQPYIPPASREITKLIRLLVAEFKQRDALSLTDILEFHFLLYAIHPFQNGNKRVCRVLESLMLGCYGYDAGGTLSLAVYYQEKKDAFHFFLLESLRKKNATPFINYALRGYFFAANKLFEDNRKIFLRVAGMNIRRFYVSIYGSKGGARLYTDVISTIVEANGVISHSEFLAVMIKKGHTKGKAQNILPFLKSKNVLELKERFYFIPGALEIRDFDIRLKSFFVKHGIEL